MPPYRLRFLRKSTDHLLEGRPSLHRSAGDVPQPVLPGRQGYPQLIPVLTCFRHTVATHMVCGGATFKSVCDVLGHRTLGVTGVYAKLDLASLAKVALPWPGGAQ